MFVSFPFLEYALKIEVPSRLCALYNLFGPPSLNRFIRLCPGIYKGSIPEFFCHQG